MILAGSLTYGFYPEPTVTPTGGVAMTATDITYLTIRATFMVDYYPDPQRGLHFGGDFGIAGLSAQNEKTKMMSDHDPVGVTGGAHVGYEMWISDQWSFGAMFKASYSHMWREMSPGYAAFQVGGFQPQLVGVFTFN